MKSNFSHILQRVAAGEEIVISFRKKGKKIAVLMPYNKYASSSPRHLGLLKKRAKSICKTIFSDQQRKTSERMKYLIDMHIFL